MTIKVQVLTTKIFEDIVGKAKVLIGAYSGR
jgi:hypothetical protein